MAITFRPYEDNKRRVKEVVQTINKLKTRESVVVICPSWLDLGFVYYYNQGYFKDYKNLKRNFKTLFFFNVLPLPDFLISEDFISCFSGI